MRFSFCFWEKKNNFKHLQKGCFKLLGGKGEQLPQKATLCSSVNILTHRTARFTGLYTKHMVGVTMTSTERGTERERERETTGEVEFEGEEREREGGGGGC